MLRLRIPMLTLVAFCGGCSSSPWASSDLETRTVTLPDGFRVEAELKVTPDEMARGMMYRDSLEDGRGMLFIQERPSRSPYWMANCKIALDIIWMSSDRQVVEISAGTPPCPSGRSDCPTYGGHATAQYVLELGSGQAARHQIRAGSTLQF